MKSPELLRREELLELAALDAMGQLDEFEADHYTRSFHAAPASVQEEIRRLQAEIATDEAFLSDETMPADLKARVMGAVTAAIDEEAAALRPIASIGVRSRARSESADRLTEAVAVASQTHRLQSMQRTLVVWRAASIALAASLLTSLLWVTMISRQVDTFGQLLQEKALVEALVEQAGPGFRNVVAGGAQPRSLQPAVGTQGLMGGVFVDPASGSGYLVVFGAQTNQTYAARLVSESGEVTSLGSFTGGAWATGVSLAKVDLTKLQHERIEIVDLQGRVVMTTA
ncbi:MAG: hypothetical protein ACO32J_09240 [Phycisphaerales bacterium]|jgi:hypothetical protein